MLLVLNVILVQGDTRDNASDSGIGIEDITTIADDEQRPLLAERVQAIGRLHQRHQPPDEERDHRVEQRHGEARGEHRGEPGFCLPDEMPVESDEAGRRRIRSRARRPVDATVE